MSTTDTNADQDSTDTEPNPHPRDEVRSIDIDPPTEHTLIPVLERVLLDDDILDEPREQAAVARLLSSLEGHGTVDGELTDAVCENTVLNGIPGHIYQEKLFEYYDTTFGIDE